MFKKLEFPLIHNMNQCCTKIILNTLWTTSIFMRCYHLQKNLNLWTQESEKQY